MTPDDSAAPQVPDGQPATGDRILRAMTDDGAFRVMTIRATDTVAEAIAINDVRGAAAEQLGEAIVAAVLVRETMAPTQRVEVLIRDRADNLVVGDAFPEGRTRGLARVSDSVLGVGLVKGSALQVARSMPGAAPHQGVVAIDHRPTVSEAITTYFLDSEQVTTMVELACVLGDDGVPTAAGGFVIQLLPEVTEPPLEAMRQKITDFGDVAARLVEHDADPNWLLQELLDAHEFTGLAESPVYFGCNCSAQKARNAVAAFGIPDVEDMIAKGEPVRANCDYCRTVYETDIDELRIILVELQANATDTEAGGA